MRVRVRERRQAMGLSQAELAARAGIARQTLVAIEAGRLVPSVAVALRLARALGCRVEDLFEGSEAMVAAEPAGDLPHLPPSPFPVRVARVGGRWLAWPLPEETEAAPDGVAQPGGEGRLTVELSIDPDEAARTVIMAGCDPALGWLAARLSRFASDLRAIWLPRSSLNALRALARGEVHIAGTHLWDAATGECNLPIIARELAGRPLVIVALSRWVEGLMLPPGNPRRIRALADLARPDVRIVNRELGSGTRWIFDEQLRREGVDPALVPGYERTLPGHRAVAQAVAYGLADAGPGVLPVARRYGLDFLPLLEVRYDLVIPAELLDTPMIQRLLDGITSKAFRRELEASGYSTEVAGTVVARLP